MVDVIIVGAGAAGLAAADRLREAGVTSILLEARDRIGGRMHTDTTFANFPIDVGAEFIHGETAATWKYVRRFGLETIEVPRYAHLRWGKPAYRLEHTPAPQRTKIRALFDAYERLIDKADEYADYDISLAEYFESQGFDQEALNSADVLFAQSWCARMDNLSAADMIRELQVDRAGKRDFRLKHGYQSLLTPLAAPLDIRLNTHVSAIRQNHDGVTITTQTGASWSGRAVLVTVPIALLQAGVITFEPGLSDRKHDAIHAFRMEAATKLIYKFSERVWEDDLVFMAADMPMPRWWTPDYQRIGADAVIANYSTADRADAIDQASEAYALVVGLAVLEKMLDQSDLSPLVTDTRRVSWAADPYARGGYASLPPGNAWARSALAEPEGAVYFAGEAVTDHTNPQTVHGAVESGWRAAQQILSRL
mgnify:CR=1 FL=1